MGCCHSFTTLFNFLQSPHSPSSGITNSRSTAKSINDHTDDTIPLTSSKAKNKSRDLIDHNEENFSRIIPLLEERDPSSKFANVNDQRRFSTTSNRSHSSSSSFASLENGISNSIKENEFLREDIKDENANSNQSQIQSTNLNSSMNENTNNAQLNNNHNDDINLLYNKDDLLMSTEDEGGISGEMDSSFDDN